MFVAVEVAGSVVDAEHEADTGTWASDTRVQPGARRWGAVKIAGAPRC